MKEKSRRELSEASHSSQQAIFTASLPGKIEVSLPVWLRYLPAREYVPKLMLAVFFLVILVVVHPAAPNQSQGLTIVCSILAAVIALSSFNKLGVARRRFRGGSLCPGIILSVDPPLLAVSTDLSKDPDEAWPAIKILPQPLQVLQRNSLQVGDRVPAVSLYRMESGMAMSVWAATGVLIGLFDKPYWHDFAPEIVQCITDDPAVVQEALRRLTDSGDVWTELQMELAQVPKPYQSGLYRLRQP